MDSEKITVLIADDHGIVRRGIAALLSLESDIDVVGQASDGREVVDTALRLEPDIVLMDVSMPVLNGLEATRLLTQKAPHIRVIALSAHDNDEYVRQVMSAGASGYVLKNSPFEQLVDAIRAVKAGHTYVCDPIARTMHLRSQRRSGNEGAQGEPEAPTLTQREREILQLVAEGESHQKIAERLNISVRTVDTHSSNIMKKLDIHERAGLVTYAIKNGIVILPK